MPEFRCSHCGYPSTSAPFFRLERPWLSPGRRLYCMGCAAYRPTAGEKRSYILPVGLVAASTLLVTVISGGGAVRLGYQLWSLAILFPTGFLAILAHEIGHVLAALAVGRRATSLVIGSGRLLCAWYLGGLRIELRPFPASGRATAHPRGSEETRWRQAAFILGGVAANAAVAIGCWALLHFAGDGMGRYGRALIQLTMWVQAVIAVLNLVPYTVQAGRQRLPSDGKRLLTIIRGREPATSTIVAHAIGEASLLIASHRYAQAHPLLARAAAAAPDSALLLGLHLGVMGEVGDKVEALAWFADQRSLAEKDESGLGHAVLYSAAAWIALETGNPALTAVARSYAETAIAATKLRPAELDGIHASALIEDGDTTRGIPLAWDAIRRSEDDGSRAAFAGVVAAGLRKLGDAGTADEVARLAAHLKERGDAKARIIGRRLDMARVVPASA